MRILAWLLKKIFTVGGYRSPHSDEPVTKRDSTEAIKKLEERKMK